MRRHLLIGTPCYDGKLCVAYVRGLIDTERALRDAGVRLDIHFTLQSSLVMHARNEIVGAFLASDATDLLFIDSDIGWQATDVLRLLGHDVPMVAGVYRRKTGAVSFVVKFPQASAVRRERATGLIAASRVGAGFLRLRRDGLTRMVDAYPHLRYLPGDHPPEAPLHALFDTSLIDGDLCGEDWTFCARWQAIGGTVWVDPAIALVHIGTANFGGVLTDALRPVS